MDRIDFDIPHSKSVHFIVHILKSILNPCIKDETKDHNLHRQSSTLL